MYPHYSKYLTHLRFADDLVLLTEDHKELQYMLETLNEYSNSVGLEINIEKTKVMTNVTKLPVTLQSRNIEYVDEYTYLGHQISFSNGMDKEINRRITNTWKKYWSMRDIFKGTLPNKLKTKAMEVCLTPCLTYACQTWTLTKKQLNRIETTQRAIERSYLGIKLKDRIKNSEIRLRTQAKNIKKILLKSKWKWAGHLQRLKDDRWTKITTNWYPLGRKRKKGRPFKRWDDPIVKVAGRVWTRLARDRANWKVLEEAFTA
ncbi:unnamed protein product [Parnassius mnemosyne]|uniref:Reverse transcriptase domain-containing protein n=1 Tax=Parnassius mnemosyne TaxID=213953 RepID=A0AAV1KUJ9_9NEOP